jgi:AraC family transcriptional regulator, regulatory protein of adaptative response / DNA-3-methyladenine glycosylase II
MGGVTTIDLDRAASYRAIQARDPRFDGRLFIAVRTTGIYCRPICPARTPKLENIVFYASAAAAQEAGFRPCLRCRPESSPELAAWRGSSNTVSRALGLIAEGALAGDADVEGLAVRLGVGERQLRRLFQKHLGASPIAVAQVRRALFAKKLLDETRMSMTEVALASGFGSVRRFNDTFRRLYARPPSTLRRRGGPTAAATGLPDSSVLTLTLSYIPPYDWRSILRFFAARAIPGVELVEGDRYQRTIEIDGARGTIDVSPLAKDNALAATIRFPNLRALPIIVARIRRMFDLDADVGTITQVLKEDRDLAPLVARRPGLRVPGAWDGFELAIRALLGQQITVPLARRLAGQLVTLHGETLPSPASGRAPGLTHVFPQAARLATTKRLGLGMPGARALAIACLAAAATDNPRLFQPPRTVEEAVSRFTDLKGIGEWTAQYIAMRALREPDAFPAADVGLLRAMAAGGGTRPTPKALLARAEAWRPWRAYAAQHLWTSEAPP